MRYSGSRRMPRHSHTVKDGQPATDKHMPIGAGSNRRSAGTRSRRSVLVNGWPLSAGVIAQRWGVTVGERRCCDNGPCAGRGNDEGDGQRAPPVTMDLGDAVAEVVDDVPQQHEGCREQSVGGVTEPVVHQYLPVQMYGMNSDIEGVAGGLFGAFQQVDDLRVRIDGGTPAGTASRRSGSCEAGRCDALSNPVDGLELLA